MIFHVIGTSIFMSLTIVLMFIEPAGILLRVINPIALFWEGVLFYDFRELISLRWDLGFVSLVGVIFFLFTPWICLGIVLFFPYLVCVLCFRTKQVRRDCLLTKISYEIYLCGWPIQQMIVHFGGGAMNPTTNFLMAVPLTMLMGMFIYWVVEKTHKFFKHSIDTKC